MQVNIKSFDEIDNNDLAVISFLPQIHEVVQITDVPTSHRTASFRKFAAECTNPLGKQVTQAA